MANRWQMNRMGFINFWLYDDEVFTFADGCLLLRGANGSGKSITTQSMIPFILDGDRSPSRLDPFGSVDRKMEYYFLGQGEQNDVTGYLFLEFKLQGQEQYRTIGIGQRAQRGKPMEFWGFVVLDGRRVGFDLLLYKEIGNRKIPHSRQILKNLLGETNPLVIRQREYMELVNKYLFGFPKLEQYEQFVQLMIKVRAPKLSRDFKPSRIYDILNESLQTLSDIDLRAMVEAMEKMDDIQANLAGLEEAQRDAVALAKEYQRYSDYLLGQKGQNFLQCYNKMVTDRQSLAENEAKLKTAFADKLVGEQECEALKLQRETLQREQAILNIADIQHSMDKLAQDKAQSVNLQGLIAETEQQLAVYQTENNRYELQIKDCVNKITAIADRVMRNFAELNDYNELIKFTKHAILLDMATRCDTEQPNGLNTVFSAAAAELDDLHSQVRHGLMALEEAARQTLLLSQATEREEQLTLARDLCVDYLKTAEQLEDDCRDKLIEGYYALVNQVQELPLSIQLLNQLASLISRYHGPQDRESCSDLLRQCRDERAKILMREVAEIVAKEQAAAARLQVIRDEISQLQQAKEASPSRNQRVSAARTLLAAANISCIPFYEAVEFCQGLTTVQQALLESQIHDVGILDALVVAADDYPQARELLQDQQDTLIKINDAKPVISLTALQAADISVQLQAAVNIIINSISLAEDEGATLVLSPDGYYRHGLLEGHSVAADKAIYIGRQAREAARAREIADKTAELAAVAEEINRYVCQRENLQKAEDLLQREYEQLPSFVDLDQALVLVETETLKLQQAEQACTVQAKELADCRQAKKQSDQQVIACCRDLPYLRSIENYKNIAEDINSYKRTLQESTHQLYEQVSVWSERSHLAEKLVKNQELREEAFIRLRRDTKSLQIVQAEIAKLVEIVHSPDNVAKAQRYEEIAQALAKNEQDRSGNDKKLAALMERIGSSEQAMAGLRESVIAAEEKYRVAKVYFCEDIAISSSADKNSLNQVTDDKLLAMAEQVAPQSANQVLGKSLGDMIAALMKAYQQHSGSLTRYGITMEEIFAENTAEFGFQRKRIRYAFFWKGQKIYLAEFCEILTATIDEIKLLIQEKDRELFENILTDTLGRKLSNRIMDSQRWIAAMSELMRQMDTSMGMSFSLTWKPIASALQADLDSSELEKLLSRDRNLLAQQDINKVADYFRNRIRHAKEQAADNGETINYPDLVRNALDYRQWYEFRLYFLRENEGKKELTNSAFNKFSGGEKAMAMYVPLLAAVNAQYKKSDNSQHPRIIALDEAFAGVDDQNISSMFALVERLDFDYIMNSQALWGCYFTVPMLRIAELLRPANSPVVTVINYIWNGHERILE